MANVIDSLNFGDTKYSLTLPYGSCSTAAATAAKAVTVDNFNLDTGAMIAVKFTVTNSASSPTLNVNSTGAKAIYYKGAAITAGYLAANKTYMFVYNGTQWELMGDVDTNTSPKNATITLTAGKGLTDGGNFTTNQSSAETITFNVGAGTGITVTDDAVAANLNSTTSLGTIGTTSKLYAVGVDANGKLCVNVPWTDTNTDTNTCNTAGSHEKSDKLFLVGCLNQGPYYETFSNSKCYASGGYLYSNGTKVLTSHQSLSNYSTLTNTIKSLSISGKTITYTKGDGTTGTLTTQDTDTTYSNFVKSGSGAKAGLVPAPSTTAGTTKYLREDGTWAVPPDNNTTYSAATQSAQGLMSAADKKKLDGIATSANNYTHPSTHAASMITGLATVATSGSYNDLSNKPTIPTIGTGSSNAAAGNHTHTATLTNTGGTAVTSLSHGGTYYLTMGGNKVSFTMPSDSNTTYGVVSTTANGLAPKLSGSTAQYLRADGTWATPPDTNTTYGVATTSANGLMSSTDKSKLDGIQSGASATSFSPSLTSGTKIGTITINGTATDLYCQTNTNTTYKAGTGLALSSTTFSLDSDYYATTTHSGLMSAGDKEKLDGIAAGATALSIGTTSTTAAAGNHSHSSFGALSTGTLTVASASSDMFTVKYNSSNKFRVASNGGVYGSKYYTSGADYSEFMEWADQNLNKEDRRGYFVTIAQDETIRIANTEDDVIGVISSTPSVIGNDATFEWHKKYLTDVYGNYIMEEVFYPETTDENGEVIPAHTMMEPKLNPEYDPNMEYIPRSERPEWAAIGMLGQLIVRDDGTCQPGKYCKCNDNGIATISEGREGWRVIKRLDNHHVKILFK